jgi:ABC-2 type transport system permease protein
MTWVLFAKLLRDLRGGLLLVALVLFLFHAVWIKTTQRITTQLYPVFQGMAQAQKLGNRFIEDKIFRGPGKVVQTMMGGENVNFQRASDLLAVGYLHPLIQVIFCLWAIGRASGAIAGELERGTMELLLAQPLARWQLLLAHLAVDVVVIPLLCLSMFAGTYVGIWLVGPLTVDTSELANLPFAVQLDPDLLTLDPWLVWPGLWCSAGLLFALSGTTLWLSACGRFRWRTVGVATLLALVMFLVNLLGQLWDDAAFLRPFTLFYYYQPQLITLQGVWQVSVAGGAVPMVPLLFGVGALGYAAAAWVFLRRDLPAPL